jgi:hypothetical protein
VQIVEDLLVLAIFRPEADDHAVDGGLAACFIGPLKSAVGEVDEHALGQHPVPQHADLLTLADRVGRDEGHPHFRVAAPAEQLIHGRSQFRVATTILALEVAHGLEVPGGDIVENAVALQVTADQFKLLALFGAHELRADERRVAEQIAQAIRRHQLGPVQLECVALDDARRGFERNAGKVHAEFLANFHVHLMVGQPQRHARDLGRKFLDLDTEELIDIEPDQGIDIQAHLPVGALRAQHFQFQVAQLAVGHHQKVAAAAGRVEEGQ